MRKLKIFVMTFMLGIFVASFVWAEKYSLKEITPAAQAALDSRRDRYDELGALKAKGTIGENNRGYVELLSSDSSAQGLVQAENRDRAFIYKTIAEQNGLNGELGTIEKVFAQVQRDKAKAGDKIQNDNGQWLTK